MLYPVSEVRTFVAALNHPEGLAVACDRTIYAGAKQVTLFNGLAAATRPLAFTSAFLVLESKEGLWYAAGVVKSGAGPIIR